MDLLQTTQASHPSLPESEGINAAIDESGRTMLIFASSEGVADIVEALLQLGAKADLSDHLGCTALIYAAAHGHISVLKHLVAAGARLDVLGNNGWTALLAASAAGQVDCVRCLLEAGASIDQADGKKWSSLSHASFRRHLPVVHCLLHNGASPLVEDSDGRTALMYAAHEGYSDVVQALVENMQSASLLQTNVSRIVDEVKGAALHSAVCQGHIEVVRIILGNSVCQSARSTAVRLAIEHGRHEIVETIVRQVGYAA
jgi:hypothetical protein